VGEVLLPEGLAAVGGVEEGLVAVGKLGDVELGRGLFEGGLGRAHSVGRNGGDFLRKEPDLLFVVVERGVGASSLGWSELDAAFLQLHFQPLLLHELPL